MYSIDFIKFEKCCSQLVKCALNRSANICIVHTQRKKLSNLESNSWFSLPGSYRLTIRLSGTRPRREGATSPFPKLGLLFLWSEVRAQAPLADECSITRRLWWWSSSPVDVHRLNFQIPRCYRNQGGWLHLLACEIVTVCELANLSNATGKSYSLSFTEEEKLASFLSQRF